MFRKDKFCRCVTSTGSVCFTSSGMPQDAPSSDSVGPELEEEIKVAFSELSSNLSSLIEAS